MKRTAMAGFLAATLLMPLGSGVAQKDKVGFSALWTGLVDRVVQWSGAFEEEVVKPFSDDGVQPSTNAAGWIDPYG
jgi:hypothetical protein